MSCVNKGHVMSIQSHVVHGYVGNRCAVFPLQLLGFEVDFVNSVQFSCHTGYPSFSGSVLGGAQLDELVDGLDANDLLGYSHLLTGYIGSATFLRSVLRLVAKLREKGEVCYVCDPVLGDNGKLYVPEELVAIYRSEVLPLASVATPNQFEIENLSGVNIESEADAIKACNVLHDAGVPVVVVTTLDYARDRGAICMMLSEKRTQYVVEVPLLQARFTGSGDLTAALLLAWMHEHQAELPLALEKVAASVFGVLETTVRKVPERVYERDGRTVVVPPELDIVGSKSIIETPPVSSFEATICWSDPPAAVVFNLRDRQDGLADALDWLAERDVATLLVVGDESSYATLDAALAALPTPADSRRHLLISDHLSGDDFQTRVGLVNVALVRDAATPLPSDLPYFLISDLKFLRRFFPRTRD